VDSIQSDIKGIKQKLTDLQKNKQSLDSKMLDFEEKLKHADDF
jgi:phage-related minor tail protein